MCDRSLISSSNVCAHKLNLLSFYLNSNNPVTIQVMLEFTGRLSVPDMQQLVATVIFEDTPRYRHNDAVGHLIGDLLVYYADLLRYQDNTPFG